MYDEASKHINNQDTAGSRILDGKRIENKIGWDDTGKITDNSFSWSKEDFPECYFIIIPWRLFPLHIITGTFATEPISSGLLIVFQKRLSFPCAVDNMLSQVTNSIASNIFLSQAEYYRFRIYGGSTTL